MREACYSTNAWRIKGPLSSKTTARNRRANSQRETINMRISVDGLFTAVPISGSIAIED
jgi:hypothetical protein